MKKKTVSTAALVAALAGSLALASAGAFAADNAAADAHKKPAAGAAESGGMGSMHHPKTGHARVLGAHMMKGTVEDVDTNTGMMDVKTEMGTLKLHFPPKSVKQVKKGEEVKVHLSFTPVK